MKKLLFILLCLVCTRNGVQAQHNAMFSQYMFNGLLLNPAYAGSGDVLNITILHRNQWTGFDGAPKSSSFSAHTPLKNKKINFGLTVLNDRFGITNRTKLRLVYAYRMTIGESYLSFGIQGGVNIERYSWGMIQTNTPGDVLFSGQDALSSMPEAGAGIYFRSNRFYAGASMPSLLDSKEQGQQYHPALFTAGYVFALPNEMKLKHSVLVKQIPHSPVELDLNTNLYYKSLGLGFSYRTNDALVFLVEYTINPQFSAGYAYDATISRLGTYTKGSHEVMLRYQFAYGVNAKNPRSF